MLLSSSWYCFREYVSFSMYSFICVAHICCNFLFIEPEVSILLIYFEIFSPLYHICFPEYLVFIELCKNQDSWLPQNSAFFSITIEIIMIHEWRTFVHLNENVPLYEGTHRPIVAYDMRQTLNLRARVNNAIWRRWEMFCWTWRTNIDETAISSTCV